MSKRSSIEETEISMKALDSLRAVCSTVKLVRNPNNLAEVITLADIVVNHDHLERLAEMFAEDPAIRASFASRMRITPFDLPSLGALPEGTLGREFYQFLKTNKIDPSSLPTRPHGTNAEYIIAHLYETHDILHVVTGFGTDVPEELGLQAFYAAQSPNPHALLLLGGGLVNTMLYNIDKQDATMKAIVRGWLLGKSSHLLFGTPWNELWEMPLAEVRKRLGINVELVAHTAAGGHEVLFSDLSPHPARVG
jgi:ubiquinone biosynthesis protein Coq4